MGILAVLYVVLGYWATGVTIYANKIVIHKFGELFISRLCFALLLGWALIPIALVKTFISKDRG